ncbi:MAG: hypothetical protein WB757_09530 [Candidatus Cybelea sp.]
MAPYILGNLDLYVTVNGAIPSPYENFSVRILLAIALPLLAQ